MPSQCVTDVLNLKCYRCSEPAPRKGAFQIRHGLATVYGLRFTDHGLRITVYGSRITDQGVRIKEYGSRSLW